MKANQKLFQAFATAFVALASAQALAGKLYVFNESQQPVAGAEVLIGTVLNDPFQGNKLTTDTSGAITIPAQWTAALPLTVSANGYINATFLAVPPIENSLQMHRLDSRTPIEIQGETKEFGPLRRDGKVDFSLVFPGLRLQQLNRFDIEAMISSDVDKIKIITEEVNLPSNLTLPEQKETYILPITLNKPIYRMALGQAGSYRMTAIHGQFPLSQVVGEIRGGKSIYEVMNHFRMIGGGQRDITVNSSLAGQDIAVNQFAFNKKIAVKAGPFADSLVMFSFALVNQGELYFPTDIKRVMPNETMELVVPTDSTANSFISLMTSKSTFDRAGFGPRPKFATPLSPIEVMVDFFDHLAHFVSLPLSTATTDGGVSTVRHEVTELTPTFLEIATKPVFANGKLMLTPPGAIAGIEPVATFAVLTEAESRPRGDYQLERRYRLWELSQLGWATEMAVPVEAMRREDGKKYRWEVLFMGRRSGHTNTSEYFLDGVTHISRNYIDL